jgi:hypothetical protein
MFADHVSFGVAEDRFRVTTRLGTLDFETAEDATSFITSHVRIRLNAFVAIRSSFEEDIERYSGEIVEQPEPAF